MNKEQIIEVIKEERRKRRKVVIDKVYELFWIVFVTMWVLCIGYVIGYHVGKFYGYIDGWDNANQGIIDNINKYGLVRLFWANNTEVGLTVEKYEPLGYLTLYEFPSDKGKVKK
jgi:hypothetical protein